MLKKKKIAAACLALVLLSGCGSAGTTSKYTATDGIGISNNGIAYDTEIANAAQANGGSNEKTAKIITGDKLVYTGNIAIETLKYADTVQAIKEKIAEYGGIVENQYEGDNNWNWYKYAENSGESQRYLNLTLRIPTDKFDAFLSSMDSIGGKVTSRSQNVENITKKYNDNSVEIEALEKQQKRLLEMIDSVKTVEDMVAVETRLSDVETELKQKKNDQADMDTDVEYSTIIVSVEEVSKYTNTGNRLDISGFGEKVLDAFKNAGTAFVYVLENIVYVLIYAIPYILILAILVFFLCRRKKKKEKKDVFDTD